MFLQTLPLVFMLAGLVLYTVLAGADFGAGMWRLLTGGGERGQRISDHAHHSMGPVWEANHVWLIFVLTVFWTANPGAFEAIFTTLAIPLSSSETSSRRPRPVRSRSRRAARMPAAACSPQSTSTTATPALLGGPSGSPVMLIRPHSACAMKS